LASNDLTAIGALRAIYNAKLRIPEDISLIGFDDIYLSQFTQPALTTIRLSRTEVAEKAFNALTALINGKSRKGHEYHVETDLIIRSSTGLRGGSPHSASPPVPPQ
jgi:LacI family transcriptional regulator